MAGRGRKDKMMTKAEFEESLLRPLDRWADKSAAQVRDLLGGEAAAMVGYDQRNPHHCFDLFRHVLHAVAALPAGAPPHLRTAAFFHDVGKPAVAREKRGGLVFYGHAAKSRELAGPILSSMGYEEETLGQILFYIGRHDDFISWVLPSEPYDRSNPYLVEITLENFSRHAEQVMDAEGVFRRHSAGLVWGELLDLCAADIAAQAEYVYRNGAVVDSRRHKLAKVEALRALVEELFR